MATRLAVIALVLILVGPAATLIILTGLITQGTAQRCASPITGESMLDKSPSSPAAPHGAESDRISFPLPEGTWVTTDEFGARKHPVTGKESFHTGLDLGAPAGTSILAVADGTVTFAELTEIYGGLIVIQHRIDDRSVATAYGHMWDSGIHVEAGDTVTAGQHIGDVGSAGRSTGPHLHFEVRLGGTDGDPIDPGRWLQTRQTAQLVNPDSAPPAGCKPNRSPNPAEPAEGDPKGMVDDPTSDGRITARTLHLYQQSREVFPDTSWACYSPRPGSRSEHPLGRACDITFGNAIGAKPDPTQLEAGWTIAHWMKDNAQPLSVEYLIWQGKIWSVTRQSEGWRSYNGGGMHNPNDITGGHYDHLHVTVKP